MKLSLMALLAATVFATVAHAEIPPLTPPHAGIVAEIPPLTPHMPLKVYRGSHMHRRRFTVAAAALFAICAAFAAQPTSLRADWGSGTVQQRLPWQPGAGALMSAHDSSFSTLTPPH